MWQRSGGLAGGAAGSGRHISPTNPVPGATCEYFDKSATRGCIRCHILNCSKTVSRRGKNGFLWYSHRLSLAYSAQVNGRQHFKLEEIDFRRRKVRPLENLLPHHSRQECKFLILLQEMVHQRQNRTRHYSTYNCRRHLSNRRRYVLSLSPHEPAVKAESSGGLSGGMHFFFSA